MICGQKSNPSHIWSEKSTCTISHELRTNEHNAW
jgi:hypothetical protein